MSDEMSWIGRTLSERYKIEELLGQGGMSAVYRAYDPNLRRVVAIKLIHNHLSNNPDFVRRFEEEAAAVASLRHNNIIQVFDFNHDGPTYYIVFEFIPGETLQDWLNRLKEEKRLLPVEDVVRITASIAGALEFAHQQGLVHRDVKPANVMINVRGEPILMDFGIAKILGGTQHTATGAVLGTARYMSPEQIKGTRVDARTDLYSLGVMMFEMLGGRTPYESESVMTMMMMHVQDPIPDVRALRPDAPAHLVAVIERALAKEPTGRFATAAEMSTAVRQPTPPAKTVAPTMIVESQDPAATLRTGDDDTRIAPPNQETILSTAGEPPISPPPPPVATSSRGPNKNNNKRTWAIGGAIALLLLLFVGVAWAFLGGNQAGETGLDGTAIALEAENAAGTAVAVAEAESEPSATPSPTEAPPTPTATPTVSPTPFPEVRISNVSLVSDVYVVQYETIGFEESPDGLHIHFFFDSTPFQEAGRPFNNFFMYLGPSPYAELRLSDRPADATQMCALVANPDHTVQGESGNCFDLPTPTGGDAPPPPATATATTASAPPPPATATATTASAPPPATATATPPTAVGPRVTISNIQIQDGSYIVTYSTEGFTEQLPGQHLHFFFDNVPPNQAGLPGSGPWVVWGGPRPFNGYRVSDRPGNASQMCALVANPDHSVQLGTGNCVNLPSE